MERKNKKVFLEALLLTCLVFLIGLLLGVLFEQSRVSNIEDSYIQSDTSLMDSFAFNNYIDLNNLDCSSLNSYNLNFADKIYSEAKTLEDYEQSGKITDRIKEEHKKYDVMRTLLWVDLLKTSEICPNNVHTIVYLYEYDPKDLTKKAVNSVWSNVLLDLKVDYKEDILLLPIAVNNDVVSLNAILEDYDIKGYPSLIIDNKYVISNLTSAKDLETYLV